ncbi:MAG: ABC transporter permease [Candidatus Aminicenantes bacterium]|nr:ABC transporter permease [Candidatus Aminicenantes bacterium]
MATELARQLAIVVFIDKNISAQEKEALEQQIKLSPLVAKIDFVTSEQALSRFEQRFPELRSILLELGLNPFPPSFEITIQPRFVRSPLVVSFIERLKKEKGVQDIQFNRDWVERIESFDRLIKAIGFLLGSIFLLASLFIISNVIRLSVIDRQEEINILRLVGATNNFIRFPFVFEGIILGVLGSLLAIGFLGLVIRIFPLYVGQSLGAFRQLFELRFLSFSQIAALMTIGGTIGLIGSLSSLSRFLKI